MTRRFAPAFRALGVCEHSRLRYRNFECSNLIGRNQFIPLRHTINTCSTNLMFDELNSPHSIALALIVKEIRLD